MKLLTRVGNPLSSIRLPESRGFWITMSAVVLGVEVVLSFVFWDWLSGGESGSTTIRNIGFIIAGSVALPLAIWRAIVADRQASASQEQADIAQLGLLNERYQMGAEMLGDAVLSVRMGGIYALQRLAEKYPEEYHLQIMTLLCAFVRNPIEDNSLVWKHPDDNSGSPIRPDVKVAMDAIASRGEQSVALEPEAEFTVDLSKAALDGTEFAHARLADAVLRSVSLSGTKLHNANLSNSDITCANLSDANLFQANLQGADFTNSKLVDARLVRANLTNAYLDDTKLAGAVFQKAIMHYAELNRARMHCANLIDAELPRAGFIGAELPGAKLVGADLSDALLIGTDLSGASLWNANLSGAKLSGANLSGANLSDIEFLPDSDSGSPGPVTGLTQAQLDEACADPDNPPKLDHVLDAETGKPLVWRGKPCQ